jgi:hypothetical protein
MFDNVVAREFDVALLKLAPPAKLSGTVGIACLPEPNARFDEKELTFSGWGR